MNTNNQLYTAWSTILTFYIYVMIKKLMLVETAVIIRDKKHINLNKPHTSIADTLYDNNTTASYYTYTTNRRLIGIFINISWNRKMLGIRPKRHLGCFQEKINRGNSTRTILVGKSMSFLGRRSPSILELLSMGYETWLRRRLLLPCVPTKVPFLHSPSSLDLATTSLTKESLK